MATGIMPSARMFNCKCYFLTLPNTVPAAAIIDLFHPRGVVTHIDGALRRGARAIAAGEFMFFMRASTTMRFATQSRRASLWRYSRNDLIGATRARLPRG
jgi:hypothetical protein